MYERERLDKPARARSDGLKNRHRSGKGVQNVDLTGEFASMR